ncbi:uncharacterized protein LOC126678518 [Mercurialis annua]|uniref:uncharacterized protein LOC126678518 n=1 Tax=Mercurialis annua TaxID=3986 RepID=UPI00215F6353|nr:uncharacterized protein LOC126678518 [Mercurialis annua]
MGCISSKLMPRSMSLKEQYDSRSISFLQTCTSSKVARELRSGSFSNNNQQVVDHALTDNRCEQGGEGWFSEHEQDKKDHTGAKRANSFHTVEEYDALIKELRLSGELRSESGGSLRINLQEEILQDKYKIEATTELESKEHNANGEDSFEERELLEKGLKRKSIAKRLDSIEIPHTIEFSAVGSLKEWFNSGGQVNSPGAYVTPKMGNFYLPNECNVTAVFTPELVDAFEKPMQQLEAEAENILKHISDDYII